MDEFEQALDQIEQLSRLIRENRAEILADGAEVLNSISHEAEQANDEFKGYLAGDHEEQ